MSLPCHYQIVSHSGAIAINEIAGFDEMAGFEVLDGGQTFRSEFESGLRVTTSPKEKTYKIEGARSVATKGTERLA